MPTAIFLDNSLTACCRNAQQRYQGFPSLSPISISVSSAWQRDPSLTQGRHRTGGCPTTQSEMAAVSGITSVFSWADSNRHCLDRPKAAYIRAFIQFLR
jgi:hypothetical protein